MISYWRAALALMIFLLVAVEVRADDLDIYGGQTITLQPNVLIIFDNSMSMSQRTTATGTQTKLQVAKAAVTDLINRTSGVRFGLMVFNTNNEGGRIRAEQARPIWSMPSMPSPPRPTRRWRRRSRKPVFTLQGKAAGSTHFQYRTPGTTRAANATSRRCSMPARRISSSS